MKTKRFEVGDVITFANAETISKITNRKSLSKVIRHYRQIPGQVYIPVRSLEAYYKLPDEKNGFGEVVYRKNGMLLHNSEVRKTFAIYEIKPEFKHLADTYVRISK